MMTGKSKVTRCGTRYNLFTRFMALLMVFALCMSNSAVANAASADTESVESSSEGSSKNWTDGTTTTFVWEDDEKTVTVEVSDAAALPDGAEFVVEDLTDEEYEASKQLIIDQTFRDDSEYGDTEEERVAYAQAVLSGLVLYDMHFVYEGTEYDVDSTQMKVIIENKTAAAAEETVVTEDGNVYVIGDIEDSSVVAIHIEETDDGENVVEVTDDASMDEDGAIESVELTVESFSTIGYYPLTEYQQLPITDDTLINDWGGSYTLYFILNNYNIFTSGNAVAQHTVGAVAVGGTSSFTYGIGASNYGTHPVPSYFHGGFTEGGFNSYIGGNAIYFTGYDSNVYSWAYQSYDVRFNDGGKGTIDLSVTHDNGYFINFDAAMDAIKAEVSTYVNDDDNIIKVDLSNTSATLANDLYSISEDDKTVNVTSGHSYLFEDLDSLDYINVITEGDTKQNVNIISKESDSIVLPWVKIDGKQLQGTETDEGCGVVFMLPNASTVDVGKYNGDFLGHVVAPNAAVVSSSSGNTNGSFVCASFNVPSMENHMWHYNGSLITPDTHSLTALKTLDGAAPTDADDEFSFTLSELNADGEWKVKQTKIAAYTTGLVTFDTISYSETGTHWYLISEVTGVETKYTFDDTLYLVKVVVTPTVSGNTTTYDAAATYYTAKDGYAASDLITTVSGVYTVDTNKLDELTLPADAETSEIFTFANTTVKGSLWITKSVTVNGGETTSTDADGTYTFYVKDTSGNIVRTVEITITNGESNTVEVTDLPIGTYIVEEDISLNKAGMTLKGSNDISVVVTENGTYATSTASFTNDMEKVGSLKITKNVTINGESVAAAADETNPQPTAADGTYTFQIKNAAGELKDTITITIEYGRSSTVQVDNLAEGKYYILEVLSSNPYGMELVGSNSIVVEVTADNTANIPVAEFTNNLTQTGSLKITKNVTVNGKPATEFSDPTAADGTYTFYIVQESTGKTKADRSVIITNGVSATTQIDNLEPGYYRVWEYLDGNPSGMSLTSEQGVRVYVAGDNTANIPTVEFTNNKTAVGSIAITKSVTVNGNPATKYSDKTVADGTYTFYVVDEQNNEVARTTAVIFNGESSTVKIDNLVPGIYYVYEELTSLPSGMSLVTANGVEVTVEADNTASIPTVTFVNNTEKTGSLQIKKNVTINGEDPTKASDPTAADGTYTFYVVNESNTEVARKTLTIDNGVSNTVQIDNLVPGIYYVYEYVTSNPTGVTLVTPNGVEVTVEADNSSNIPVAEFTNDVEDVGSLKITKNVTINGMDVSKAEDKTAADGTYTFYVVDENNNEVARRNITIVNGESNTAQIDNLVPGIYYVYEYLAGNPTGVTLVTQNGVEVKVTADEKAEIPTVEFTNDVEDVGSLIIKKNVTVNGNPATEYYDVTEADGTYTFYVVDESNNEVARRNITIVNGVSNTAQIDNLVPGVYYVYEYLASNPNGMALATTNGVQVTVSAKDTAEIPVAEFTNNKTAVGSLEITKNVTINGKDPSKAEDKTAADGTYTFYVVDQSNNEVARRNITIVNGESKTETIENLEPGVYYVYEYLASNPYGVTLVTPNGVQVTVTANNTSGIPTAEFTNDVEDVGSLKITKNVTINGQSVSKAEDKTAADGTYTFYVVDESNNEVARRNITIVNGESKTEQIDNLVPGIYYVYEYLAGNPSGVTLVTQNGVEVKVTADNTAEIPTASFTNDVEDVGSLIIQKNVTINGDPASEYTDPTAADGTYTFYVVDESNNEVARRNITIVNGVSNTAQIDNLVPGVYYVYEYLASNPSGMALTSGNGVQVYVTADDKASIPVAEFTNNKTEVGSLSITKNVTINGEDPADTSDPTAADGTYTFYVVDAYNNEVARRNITIENGVSKTETIDNLEPGVYYVYEYLATNPSGVTLVTPNGVEVTVTANNTSSIPTAEFTNDVEAVGSLRITKNVTINGESPDDAADRTAADGTYTFYVVDEYNNEVARRNITIVNGESKTEQIDNLVPGVYYVYEYLASNPDSVTLVTPNGVEVTVKANNSTSVPTAEFTNDVEDVGSLIIKKNVTINGENPADTSDPTEADGTYTFYVVDENNNEVARRNITIVNGESNTAQIDNLKPGTYYVYEYLTTNPHGVTLVTPNGVEVTVTSDETAVIPVAEFTNDVEVVGSLKITKNVTINGEDTANAENPNAADGTYTFYVVNDENIVVARRNITIVNGESKTEEIDNLIPGTYYVYEYTDGLASNMTLTSGNEVKVTVTADNTVEIPVAEFTNDAALVASLRITKNVLINGEDPEDAKDPTEADGTYVFYVLDAAGNEVAREDLTIEHGQSATITIGNLVPGTYYVYEYTDELKEEITLITENGVEVTVSALETEEGTVTVPTVAFTNNFAEKPYKEVDATSDSGVDGSSVAIGDFIIYNVDYHNHLNESVTVEIIDALDEGVDFISASDGGVYNEETHIVTWQIPTEALAGGTVWVEVQVNDIAAMKTHVTEYVEDENGDWIEVDVEDSDVTATIDNQAKVIIVDHEYYTNLVTNEVDEPEEDDTDTSDHPETPDDDDDTDSSDGDLDDDTDVETGTDTDTDIDTDTDNGTETEDTPVRTSNNTKKTGDNDFAVLLSLLSAALGVFLVAEARRRKKSS